MKANLKPRARGTGQRAGRRKAPVRATRTRRAPTRATQADTASPEASFGPADASPLEALLENCPDAVYFKDLESRFVHFSKSFQQLFNLANGASLRGKTDADFFTPEHARPAFEDEQTIIRTGQPIIGKLERETHLDGRISWALTSKMPWRDRNGRIIGTFGVSKDVTALKRAEEDLARERELLRTLLDNVPDCIYFKDRQSRFVRFSRSFERLFHVAPELIRGRTDADFFTEEHARAALEDEQAVMRTGEPLVGKPEKETHADGRVTWALTSKMPWRDTKGNIIGTFGISKDITPLKKAEAELELMHQKLIETSRLAGMAQVATDVLHNVGNALNSINVSSSLAGDCVRQLDFSKLARVAQLIQQQTGRLDEFLTTDPQGKHIPAYLTAAAENFEAQRAGLLQEIGQLRQFIDHVNQIVAMQQSYAKVAGVCEVVDLPQLLEDALHLNWAALDRHGVFLIRDFEPVPPVVVDRHKVLQILVNLISNAKHALKHCTHPRKELTLRLGLDGPATVRIQVIDNGEGIAPENLTRIFGHGFTTRKDGHGFGLHSGALAAREMGGSLTAHSDGLGLGARFTLVLPVRHTQTS